MSIEIGAFEDSSSVGSHLLGKLFLLGIGLLCKSMLWSPFFGQLLLTFWKLGEAIAVVAIPEIELEILGIIFDIAEEVHKLANGHGLRSEVRLGIGTRLVCR